MRAVQFVHNEFSINDEAGLPALGAGQILIDVHACGICGSDLSAVKGSHRFCEVMTAASYPLAQYDPEQPIVLGHEYAGVVAEVGPDVTDFAVGDRVTGLGLAVDMSSGIPKIIGYSNTYHGAFGEQIIVNTYFARHIPDGLSFEHAALAEPLHVGEMHMQQSGLTADDSALVVGCGTIGLGAISAAKARGAKLIIASEPSAKRRELALKMGADIVVDPTVEDPVERFNLESQTRGLTDGGQGGGMLIAFECSGRKGMLDWMLRNLPFDSKIQVMAAPFEDETIIPAIGQVRRMVINFGHGTYDQAYEAVLDRLAKGEIDADAIITGRVDLSGVADAFATLRQPDEHVKIMVFPRGVDSAADADV
jgi:threonine dehydrogenase-like Zn-dependent dehydrogenase